jgi:hypothetical protein
MQAQAAMAGRRFNMDFHELGKFWAGKDPEGMDRFNIPLTPDEQGMVGRECPNERCETKYFKISLGGTGSGGTGSDPTGSSNRVP